MSTIDPSAMATLGLTTSESTTNSTDSKNNSSNALGQDAFLRLLTAQLSNQDPTNPTDNTQFISQLAQFSSLSQMQQLNGSFGDLSTALYAQQAVQASNLVGHQVLMSSDQLVVSEGRQGASGSVELSEPASNLTVLIQDNAGQTIAEIPLGSVGAGLTDFHWDGMLSNGEGAPPGTYKMKAQAMQNGAPLAVPTLASLPVESVSVAKGNKGITINTSGAGSVAFSDVREIR